MLTPTTGGLQPSIIDLHSIHDGGTPLYVFQTLEEMFGSRDEIREHVLCPGILDALGRTAGVRFLEAVRVAIEAQGEARERVGLSPFTGSIRAISRFLASLPDRIPEAPATSEQRYTRWRLAALVSSPDVPRTGRKYPDTPWSLRTMHAVTSLIIMLLIGMLTEISWGQPFVTYDLRVNGAIITVIAADLRGDRRRTSS